MKVLQHKISIYSDDPDTLMFFYRDVLKFAYERKVDAPNDYGYFFVLSENLYLFVGKHSEITGNNTDSLRHIFDLQVPSVHAAYAQIKDAPGVVIIAPPFQAPCSLVATFTDPEGNCWQFSEPMIC